MVVFGNVEHASAEVFGPVCRLVEKDDDDATVD